MLVAVRRALARFWAYSGYKMKIAMVISALGKGGAERVLSVLANFFCRENEVCVIKFDADEPFYALDPKIELLSLDLGVGDLGVFGNIKKRYDKF